jgi:hypothetical protein
MTTHDSHGPPDLEELLDDPTLIGYAEMAAMTDRREQSLRMALMRRRKRVAATGRALRTDIPEPAGHEDTSGIPGRESPRWRCGEIRQWAMRKGMIAADGITPIPYRGARRKDDEVRQPHTLAA